MGPEKVRRDQRVIAMKKDAIFFKAPRSLLNNWMNK